MIQRFHWALALALGLVVFTAGAAQRQGPPRGAPIEEPPAISIPEGVATADAVRAIHIALSSRKWTYNDVRPGYIEADLIGRGYQLKIGIRYTDQQIQIGYVSSTGLGDQMYNGVRYLNRKYRNWTRNLTVDITSHLQHF